MKHMTIKAITTACSGTYYGPDDLYHKEISSVTIDSRHIEPDTLFVALRGARVDGHLFIAQAIQDGALCAISEKRLDHADFPYILVDSSAQALKDIAEYYRKQLQIKVVGISGSVGKTSTKEMIASVLSQHFQVLKTEGNFNNEIGLPLTIFKIREEHEIAVLEMGISNFGEMERLSKIARPDICVLTNIGCAHLEQLKSREGILKAKTEMFEYMNPHGQIVLNGDDDLLRNVTPLNHIKPVLFGKDETLPFHSTQMTNLGLQGSQVVLQTPNSQIEAHISIPGDHMVYNALAATAVARLLGLTDAEIVRGIEALVPLAGRNHLIQTKHLMILDDCYNANPASMTASLDVLAKATGRTVAILGDMFELGESERVMHQGVGKHAAEIGIHTLICIGALAKEIANGATTVRSQTQILHFETKEEFLKELHIHIQEGDTILVKASHGMHFEQLVTALQAFTI
jgi:UDP-N-acetylmuramoyl-tripeptide--D-alanyl-D-alanine ligase